MSEEGIIFGLPFVPPHFEGIEGALFRHKTIRGFMDKIKQSDIEIAIRDLCLLGIEVFRDRNPTLAHYSLKEIQRCLHNFVEEKSVRDYYRNIKAHSDEEDYLDESNVNNDCSREINEHSTVEREQTSKTRSRSKTRSKSKGRNKINNATQSPRIKYESSPQHQENSYPNYHQTNNQFNNSFNAPHENQNNKGEAYYYYRRPPTHSSVPVNPVEMHGPPPQVAPYFYYTDKDLELFNGEKDNRRVITTVSRQTDMFIGNSINKRVATSPLKSCIQGAEVKIARGGVAVSFDPWKEEKSQEKCKANNQTSKEYEFEQQYDHLPNEDELRISDGKYFNSLVKSIGIKPKIDPKVQKLAKRDMELAMKKRETLEIQRKNDKKQRHKSHARNTNKTRLIKNHYRNVQSKIKHSVQMDRSRAKIKSACKSSRKEVESISRSPVYRQENLNEDIRDIHERRISDRINMMNMNRSFNDTAKPREYQIYDRVTLNNPNISSDEVNEPLRNQAETLIEAHKLNKSSSCIDPNISSRKSLEKSTSGIDQTQEYNRPTVPQCEYKKYKPLRNPYNATAEDEETRQESTRNSKKKNSDVIKPYKR